MCVCVCVPYPGARSLVNSLLYPARLTSIVRWYELASSCSFSRFSYFEIDVYTCTRKITILNIYMYGRIDILQESNECNVLIRLEREKNLNRRVFINIAATVVYRVYDIYRTIQCVNLHNG